MSSRSMRRLPVTARSSQFTTPKCILGLVKMDFSACRNLTTSLTTQPENVKASRGEDIDLDALSKDMTDKATYQLLGCGDTLGVFQLDGGGRARCCGSCSRTTFENISGRPRLYRLGPMGVNRPHQLCPAQNGKQVLIPLDPNSRGVANRRCWQPSNRSLGMTHGLGFYQSGDGDRPEAGYGYTLGNADLLRRAMGKKKKEVPDKEYVPSPR